MALYMFNLNTRWRLVVGFTFLPLCHMEIATGAYWIGSWVGPKPILDILHKIKTLSHSGNSTLIPQASGL
jgi:hypothetical protein